MDHRSEIEIHGHCAPEFARVADAFASNFASAGEIGAAVAVCVEGELVVDLWAGLSCATTGWPAHGVPTPSSA